MRAILLFESLRPDGEEQRSFRIENPEEIYECRTLNEIEPLLRTVEKRAREGCFAAGFLAYEAGFAFLPDMPQPPALSLPLAWFAVTATPEFLTGGSFESIEEAPQVNDLRINKTPEEYTRAIGLIKESIERGDTYQVNYTLRYRAGCAETPARLYQKLKARQRVNYAALIETDEWAVVSLSPELFFRKSGRNITMRPMKGTIARGRNRREDRAQAEALRSSSKETSENLMIVDLLRNDLGKICVPGTIQVIQPMQVERYETLLQMTSTIQGILREGCGSADVFSATFPSGSVTGAPKIRTMQIIHDLEAEPRGIYTGAIGYMAGEESVFNVAIRTAFVDRARQTLEMGAGGGILYEANPENEYRECLLKAKFLTEPRKKFQLFETILWTTAGGFERLELHLDRILESADYFLIQADRTALRRALFERSQLWKDVMLRVKLTLDEEGHFRISSAPLLPAPAPLRLRLSHQTVNSANLFLFHKTTNRQQYDEELTEARTAGFFDIIFRNERGEITEGAVTNIILRFGNNYFTPPAECGLLAGTYRRHLLESQEIPLREKILNAGDLLNADEILICNALRGLQRARFESS